MDQVVIQQGRLVNNKNKLQKEDMLGMIRHGASEVFAGSGDGGDPNDIDIDKLLKEGQDKTEEMDKQMDGKCLKIIAWSF